MPASQAARLVSITTVLGPDVLLFGRMTGTEHLSVPFEFALDLLSERIDIRAEDLLGTPATVALWLQSGEKRFFNGYISRLSYVGSNGAFSLYQATLVPWLWFLSRSADCRIFQDQTVPDIVKATFRGRGFTDFEERLSGNYRQWNYCVQYRETDLSFVSRLLEHEGIYYFHEHQNGKHTLVLADSHSAHSPAPGYEQVAYFPQGRTPLHDHERIDDWRVGKAVRVGAFAHDAFDFTAPRKELLSRINAPKSHALAESEVFDYQGDYTKNAEGEGYARIRLEECQADYEVAQAAGNVRGLACGAVFTLQEHPRNDQNRQYLIVSASYELQSDDYRSAAGANAGQVFACRLRVTDSQVPYRSPRVTPKPIVQGPQTAIVVGKAGEEIWTDKYGRIKVQFHWDRYGHADETSSCWVRVAQVWAGKNWGGMMIPRIGQEVIVDFLEGDPDQPIVTGRVYNGDQLPPWDLPANMTQSGVLTRSTKGGGSSNANALRFEDKKDAEKLWLHAEKDQDIEVENDESHWVGHDRTKTIDHDERTHVKHDRTETVDHNETISIGVNRSEDVGKNESVSIGENRTEDVGKNESVSIGKNRTTDIGENESRTVGKDETIDIGQNRKDTIAKNVTIEVGEKRQTNVGKDDLAQVGKKFYLEAGDEITLKTGSASLTLKKDGTIQIKGKDITVVGTGKIGIKASGDLVIKGAKIAEN